MHKAADLVLCHPLPDGTSLLWSQIYRHILLQVQMESQCTLDRHATHIAATVYDNTGSCDMDRKAICRE